MLLRIRISNRFRFGGRFHLFGLGGGGFLRVDRYLRGGRGWLDDVIRNQFLLLYFLCLLLLAGDLGEMQGREQGGDVAAHVQFYTWSKDKLTGVTLCWLIIYFKLTIN